EPRARRAAVRVELPPAAKRLLERLRRQILSGQTVAGEVDEVAVDSVEILRDDFREGLPTAGTGSGKSRWHRVHGVDTAPNRRSVTSVTVGSFPMRRLLL